MNWRFFSLLLIVVILVTVTACGTTTPRPGTRPQQERPVQTGPTGRESEGRGEGGPQELSFRSMAEVAELSRETAAYPQDLALEIIRSLEPVPSRQLANMIETEVYDPEFSEWLELVLLVRKLLMKDGSVSAAAKYWGDYHYGHVINRADFPKLVSKYRSYFPTPARVAVLLPTEGGLAAAGKAIRDGIISAYMEQPGGSVIRFYSSGDNTESAMAAYYQAREEGSTQIIGPLRAESAQALADLADHDVPILLLNDLATKHEPGPGQLPKVSSLSLSQTREAAVIAEQVLDQGLTNALVIVPGDAWGQRISAAFSTVFIQGEGQIRASASFNPAVSDHSTVLTEMLKIDESRQRKQNLQSRLGIPLEFEPNRRDDFDFIFLAANPVQGRELKPLFKFHDTGEVPVYAMSRVYSGRAETDSDRDLDGVVFPVAPWQLEAAGGSLPALESLRNGSFGNLYALGRDAWELLPWIPLLQNDPDLEFPGSTGALRLQTDGHLSRRPSWAQFSAGRPRPYAWPDRH